MAINILGKNIDVEMDKNLSRDWSANGSHCGNACRILIDQTTPQDRQRSVLIHEIIESLNYELELGLEHPNITRIESGLFQVMKENGGIDWIDKIIDLAKDK